MKKLFILVALLGTLIPVAFVVREAGGLDSWQGVLPGGTTDSRYYYARIREVVDGYPLIGNPYVYEYRNEYSPAFFLPDIISAMPMLLGLPFNLGLTVNVFVWSLIFLLLSFKLFRELNVEKRWAFLSTVLAYLSVYSFMLRPTVMQIVYPAFLAFLIVLIKFLKEPEERKRIIWLAGVSAGTFYIYSYLSYIVLFSLAFIFLWYLLKKRSIELKSLLKVAALSVIILIPFGIYTWAQIGGTYYFETLTRIGLIYTHRPAIEALFYGRWIVIALGVLGLLYFFSNKDKDGESIQTIFWFSTGMALLVSLVLNVITGIEMELAIHIGRFIILWMVLVLGISVPELYRLWRSGTRNYKFWIAGILIMLFSAGVLRNIPRGLGFFSERATRGVAELQSYALPLKWLDENILEESVIWSNESIGEYVPIMTKHYPYYFHGAKLHSMPTRELDERKLLWEKWDFSKYKADYVIIDRAHDDTANVPLKSALYDDGRFAIVLAPPR